jgi:sulfur carrier protein ThiS
MSTHKVPIFLSAQREWLETELPRFFKRFNIKGTMSYSQGEQPVTFYSDTRAIGTLTVKIADVEQNQIWVEGYPLSLYGELAVPFEEERMQKIEDLLQEMESKATSLRAVSLDESIIERAKWHSIRAIKRSANALWKADQFIHSWRSFNSVYSAVYRRDTHGDSRSASQEDMFKHVLGLLDKETCRQLIDAFLEKYDFQWIRALKGEAQELWEDLKKRYGLPEKRDYRYLLNKMKGLDFWTYYEQKDYQTALKELVSFIYGRGRNSVFHGEGELDDDPDSVNFLAASIDLISSIVLPLIPMMSQKQRKGCGSD